jgi:hypothetical protein
MQEDVDNLKAMAIQEQLKVDRKCEPFANRGTCASVVGMLAPSLVTINQSVASKTTELVVPPTKGSRWGKYLATKTFAHHRKCSLCFNVD